MGYSRTVVVESAIKYALDIGMRLQSEAPQIADLYRRGMRQRDIALEINTLLEKLGATSADVKVRSVGFAIRGYAGGGYGIGPFRGLIEDMSELERLAEAHMGKMTHEQRIEAGRKGGKISGRRAFKKKIALFAEGYEKRLKLAGRKSALARGAKMWDETRVVDGLGEVSEEEYAHRLSADPSYMTGRRYRGQDVMNQVNAVFNNNRTLPAIHKVISRYKRKS